MGEVRGGCEAVVRLLVVVTAVGFIGSCASGHPPPGGGTEPAPAGQPAPPPGRVPADHTKDKDGVRHRPGYKQPEGVCNPCHGARLEGSAVAPSCTACHGREWD